MRQLIDALHCASFANRGEFAPKSKLCWRETCCRNLFCFIQLAGMTEPNRRGTSLALATGGHLAIPKLQRRFIMLAARRCAAALAITIALAFALGFARTASAQCCPDSPTDGNAQRSNCLNDDHPAGLSARSWNVYDVPLHVFVSNPIVSAVTWMSTRPNWTNVRVAAGRTRGAAGSTLRGGRTPKQVAW